VSALNMTGYDNGNELIDFGMSFTGRPEYIEVDFTYSGGGDSCDIYIVLENRTLTENQGMNQYRSSSDVNTLVASAWYRATTDEDLSDPDVDSITTNESGFKTLRMKLQYGTPLEGSPIYDTVIFSDQLQNGKGIDNHLVQGTGEEDVTHIRMAMASSAKGDVYKGTVGATLIVDDLRLIY
ncbi:MAG TPA: PCMD domain-containing protein, partial [Fibrobacteraceae bacterium]|nr:PCMD domain-containing protein [Fibrobacteraceae bacterium]